jgi:hypothetical protein
MVAYRLDVILIVFIFFILIFFVILLIFISLLVIVLFVVLVFVHDAPRFGSRGGILIPIIITGGALVSWSLLLSGIGVLIV